MLGYVKCQSGDMLVKHHALYQAMYCGLCNSIKENVGLIGLPFLSYDFVFLAFLRLLVTKEEIETEGQFCLFHPFSNKKKRVKDNAALRFCSQASLILTSEKLKDDLLDGDCPLSRRLLARVFHPLLENKRAKLSLENLDFSDLSQKLSFLMKEGRKLEMEKADLDSMCSFFAECMSLVLSFGIEGNEERVLSGLGDKLGRFLYTLDALDDIEKDEENGSFNPILLKYGSLREAEKNFSQIDMVLAFYISEMKLALDLLEGDNDLFMICDHIICKGLPAAVRNLLMKKQEKDQ